MRINNKENYYEKGVVFFLWFRLNIKIFFELIVILNQYVFIFVLFRYREIINFDIVYLIYQVLKVVLSINNNFLNDFLELQNLRCQILRIRNKL